MPGLIEDDDPEGGTAEVDTTDVRLRSEEEPCLDVEMLVDRVRFMGLAGNWSTRPKRACERIGWGSVRTGQLGRSGPTTPVSGYSSFRHERGAAGCGFGVLSSSMLKNGATNGSGACTV